MRKLFTILVAMLSIQFSFNLSAACIKGNCVNGQGTYNYASGSQYIGEWKDGNFHGQGTYNFANGDQYIGEYKDDKRHGQGTYTWVSGTSKKGIWRNNEYIGTVAEVERKRKEEAERKEAERKIYNACILDKSSDVDMTISTIRRVVQETCEAISEDPSFYESWKYE